LFFNTTDKKVIEFSVSPDNFFSILMIYSISIKFANDPE
jgi:hypothetical protein